MLIAACDPITGVRSEAVVDSVATYHCAREILRKSGIVSVSREIETPELRAVQYRITGLRTGYIQYIEHPGSSAAIRIGYTRVGSKMRMSEIKQAEPTLRAIQELLYEKCKGAPHPSQYKTTITRPQL
jgi:hypothetical protein